MRNVVGCFTVDKITWLFIGDGPLVAINKYQLDLHFKNTCVFHCCFENIHNCKLC